MKRSKGRERLNEHRLRVALIASTPPYQEAAAWAAATYAAQSGPKIPVEVFVPKNERLLDLLAKNADEFGFWISRFPFRLVSDKKFTSQLKCQACLFCVQRLAPGELLLLADADTCCLKPLTFSAAVTDAVLLGQIGLVRDIQDRHTEITSEPWYLTPQERLRYVNSGVMLAARAALPLFEAFASLSETPNFLEGPFNDQKVINYLLGKRFRTRLALLPRAYNQIGPPFAASTVIAHCAGGAGWLGVHQRKIAHEQLCADALKQAFSGHPQPTDCVTAITGELAQEKHRTARVSVRRPTA